MGLPISLKAGSNEFVWPELWLGTYTYNLCLDYPAVTSVSRVAHPGEFAIWDNLPYEAGEILTFECATSEEHFIMRPGDEVTIVVSEDVVLDYTPPVVLGTPTPTRLIAWPSYWAPVQVSDLVGELQALGATVYRISKWTPGTGYISFIPGFSSPGSEYDFLISAGDVIFFSVEGSVLYGEDVSPEPGTVPDPVVPLILGGIFVVAVLALLTLKKK